jgi:predicted phosphodiesterase
MDDTKKIVIIGDCHKDKDLVSSLVTKLSILEKEKSPVIITGDMIKTEVFEFKPIPVKEIEEVNNLDNFYKNKKRTEKNWNTKNRRFYEN